MQTAKRQKVETLNTVFPPAAAERLLSNNELLVSVKRMDHILPYLFFALKMPALVVDALIQNAPVLFIQPLFQAIKDQCISKLQELGEFEEWCHRWNFYWERLHWGNSTVHCLKMDNLKMKCSSSREVIDFELKTWLHGTPFRVISPLGLFYLNGSEIKAENSQVFLPVVEFCAQIREDVNEILWDLEERVRLERLTETELDRVMDVLRCRYGDRVLSTSAKRDTIVAEISYRGAPPSTLLKILLALEAVKNKKV